MKSYLVALWAEFFKARRSRVVWVTLLVSSLVPFVGGLFMIILKDPEQARHLGLIGTKAQLVGGTADWPAYFELLYQAGAIVGLLVFGFIAVWVFGREYSDRTMKDLLALPTPRWSIVAAKFSIVAGWSIVLAVWFSILGFAIGAAVDIPQWSRELAIEATGNLAVIFVLTIAVITPVCLVTNIGRGYLSPLCFLILMLALAQILVVMGWGDYFPWSVPSLSSGTAESAAGQPNFVSYIIVTLTGITGLIATFAWWHMTDQTR